MAIKAGVVGAAGFAGIELVRLLLRHPDFELVAATSDALEGTPIAKAYPAFVGATDLAFCAHSEEALAPCEIVFLAVPHTAAMGMAPQLIAAGKTVIDLSADFRLKNPDVYQEWYGTPHVATDLLQQAAFGLPEITGPELAAAAERRAAGEAVLVGCAGCYPTATSLAAIPAIKAGLVDPQGIVIADAISGVTGAGKKASERTHFCFANESVEAYGVATHRHTPEIEQILGIEGRLVFTPHLAPLNRGLLSTVNLPLAPEHRNITADELQAVYEEYYRDSHFVRVLRDSLPKTGSVAGTDFAHVAARLHDRAGMIVALGAIDNLGKGAAGQAVQCANIVCGLDDRRGLEQPAYAI